MKPRIGSLFSGYAGLDMAVEAVTGGDTVWVSDIDPGANKILAHHWPDVPNLGDISAVDWDSVQPVDTLTGGFPCQDVSAAGKRAGLVRYGDSNRSGLWAEMARAIDILRPALVVAENVRGLLSAKADAHPDVFDCLACMAHTNDEPMRALGAVLGDLAALGYDAAWHGVRASDVGAPHQRFRVFVIAWPADTDHPGLEGAQPTSGHLMPPGSGGNAVALLPTPDAIAWSRGPRSAEGMANPMRQQNINDIARLLPTPGVADAMGGHATRSGARSDELLLPGLVKTFLPTPVTAYSSRDAATWRAQRPAGNGGERELIGDLRIVVEETLLPPPRAADASGVRGQTPNRTDDANARAGLSLTDATCHPTDWGVYAAAIHRWETITRHAPAPTETAPRGGQRLSPRFVEWMMGLPAGHVTDPAIGLTRNEQLKALGNGVVPQQAEHAIRHLLAAVAA